MYGLDPNDPRYKELVAQMMRQGRIQPMTMESQVEAELAKPIDPGMLGPYADDNAALKRRTQSLTGRENAIKQQMAMANQMRGRAGPQGREVGPYDVYMGPNTGEILQDVTNKLAGGWLAGSAGKQDIALDEARSAAALEKALEEERRYNQEFNLDVRSADLAEAGFDAERDEFRQKLKQDADQAAATLALSQARLDFDEGKGNRKVLQKGDDPTQLMSVIEDVRGQTWEVGEDGKPARPINTSGWVDFSAGTAGSTSSGVDILEYGAREDIKQQNRVDLEGVKQEDRLELSEAEEAGRKELARLQSELRLDEKATEAEREATIQAEIDANNARQSATIYGRAMTADNLYDATGLNPVSLIPGMTGFAAPVEGGDRVQSTQREIQQAGFEGASKDFQRLKLGQISKPEFETVMNKANISWKTQPYGIISAGIASKDLYGPALDKGIAAGTHTPEQKREVMQGLDEAAVLGAMLENPDTGNITMTPKELRNKGVDVDTIKSVWTARLDAGVLDARGKAALLRLLKEDKKRD
jgi:hypothetical protein